ncbi:Arginine-tRNA-transferase [Cordyceps militaris]|uniref:arginyltransferase n=1 Tax=Cordyceps militaris TaxID=73501 RepID=A0A2H4SCZ6_CORMI|nr:Arginine-tRNA-transferase [Cordyceps militaris]
MAGWATICSDVLAAHWRQAQEVRNAAACCPVVSITAPSPACISSLAAFSALKPSSAHHLSNSAAFWPPPDFIIIQFNLYINIASLIITIANHRPLQPFTRCGPPLLAAPLLEFPLATPALIFKAAYRYCPQHAGIRLWTCSACAIVFYFATLQYFLSWKIRTNVHHFFPGPVSPGRSIVHMHYRPAVRIKQSRPRSGLCYATMLLSTYTFSIQPRHITRCGYCSGKDRPPAKRKDPSLACPIAASRAQARRRGISYYANAAALSPAFYQTLLDRYWRRSGKLMYRPNQRDSCCPHYTIRLDSTEFKPSRDQRQTINRFNSHVLGDEYAKEASRRHPRTKEESKRRNNEFNLLERVHEAEYGRLKTPPEPAHKLEITLEEDNFTEEKFAVFDNYQKVIHKDDPSERTRKSFTRFLCSSPLRRHTETRSDGTKKRLGSYHQCYRLDGKLVAIGVLDLLPQCVSSVYFLYHESIHKFSPGKLGALQEIALANEEGYRWWYPGYYIHSCPKMRYKMDFAPQYILDPVTLSWDPLDRTVLALLDKSPFVSLSQHDTAGDAVPEGQQSVLLDSRNQDEADTGEDDPDDGIERSLFAANMPGIPTLSEMETVDMDNIRVLGLSPVFLYRMSDLVGWDDCTIYDWPNIKARMAELVGAMGPDTASKLCIDIMPRSRSHRIPIHYPPSHNCATPSRSSPANNPPAMATQQALFSPAELAYLHSSLSLRPPIRPDGRAPTQFRPLTAETGILPGTHGSARVCFADGTEAIVGVKAEMERTAEGRRVGAEDTLEASETQRAGAAAEAEARRRQGREDWLEMTVEIPGQRDDEAATVFLAEMLREALLADGEFAGKLWINRRFHWRLYLDILLISPPLSYPLPLLSLTTHLALLSTRLPRLKSEGDEDPMFDDDWDASTFLYPRSDGARSTAAATRPPITLLVVAVGDNVIFDPAREELAVADTALAVSVAEVPRTSEGGKKGRQLRLLSMRTVDPPSRLTPPGVPQAGMATGAQSGGPVPGVWKAPLGGTKFGVVDAIVQAVLEKGGVADEVLDGLEGVDLA